MVLHLLMALGASAIAAFVLTIAYNYVYMTPVVARLRAKSSSSVENDQKELGWLLNHEAGRVLVRAALDSRPEDSNPAATAFYRELGIALNEDHPNSTVIFNRYSGPADPYRPIVSSPVKSIAEGYQPTRSLTSSPRGRHQTDESVAQELPRAPRRIDHQLEPDARPQLSP